jgi:serine/threonine-protein kinase
VPGAGLSVVETREAPPPREAPALRDRTPSDVFHGRFLPGTVLGQRYRIVGLLGQGGMGEVYRADDLKLGQSVALKFLPARFAGDPARLARLHDEVRAARQISHPNVCRVYDIGDADGEHFISMEYIHGEDLATLLGRIGRLPGDKATQIARQLCAGLAAAHEKGMVHRDLKPANVMLDDRGVARISDFGLTAAAAELSGEKAREGTPAYMAPEQLAGAPASVRSDVYSLGLVLYELFTGRRAFEAKTLSELLRLKEETRPLEPSRLVDNLEPAVERVILRCLEKSPRERPGSALAVAAALPGGDPLAAALAAGETPSPELVAAAGEDVGIAPGMALLCLAAVAALSAAALWLGARESLLDRIALPHSPEVLAAKARDVLGRLGHGEQASDNAWGFRTDSDYARHVVTKDSSHERWSSLAVTRPPLLRFWYRESPRPLAPESFFGPISGGGKVTRLDPPPHISGMKTLELDPQGRLVSLSVIPPQVDAAAAQRRDSAVDWLPVFAAAGLELERFRPVDPAWNPLLHTEARFAWEGSFAERPDLTVRVEAGAYAGRPVWFEIIGPWTQPTRMQESRQTRGEKAAQVVSISVLALILSGALLVARRSLRSGRSDRRGALRLAVLVFCGTMLAWLLAADHVWTAYEFGLVVMAGSWSLFVAGVVWVLYIAAEPFVRRRWPHMLISWTRLLSLRLTDPLVGRDLVIGSAGGALVAALVRLGPAAKALAGELPPQPALQSTLTLGVARYVVADLIGELLGSVFSGLAVLFSLLLLRALLRRDWLANGAFVFIFSLAAVLASRTPLIDGATSLGIWFCVLLLLRRAGVTAAVAAFFVANSVLNGPMSSDLTAWHSGPALLNLAAVAALAGYGFSRALAGRPLFKGGLLEA